MAVQARQDFVYFYASCKNQKYLVCWVQFKIKVSAVQLNLRMPLQMLGYLIATFQQFVAEFLRTLILQYVRGVTKFKCGAPSFKRHFVVETTVLVL